MFRVNWIWQSLVPKHHAGPFLTLFGLHCEIQRCPHFKHSQGLPAFCELLAYCFHCYKINIAVISHFLREIFLPFLNSPKVSWFSLAPLTTSVIVSTHQFVAFLKAFLFARAMPDRLNCYLGGSTVQAVALQCGLASPLISLLG